MSLSYSPALRTVVRLSGLLLVAAAVLVPAAPASAQVVSAFGGASGPGLVSMSFNNLATPSPGNDDVAGDSPNWIAVNQKAFGSVDYIDMVFIVDDTGIPTTEYIFSEGVHNGTGIDWTDYHLELGFGTGAGFVPSSPGDGLDFDSPDMNSTYDFGPFGSLSIGEDTIDAVGGPFLDGSFHFIIFPIDVPSGISEFTVRQYPTIAPVPTVPTSWGQIKALY